MIYQENADITREVIPGPQGYSRDTGRWELAGGHSERRASSWVKELK